ncbi:MAG: hypothetical protein JWN78_2057 [Bacteroidota bacterium]|nr:hypothetical protein [Bacteroidota bacterium]
MKLNKLFIALAILAVAFGGCKKKSNSTTTAPSTNTQTYLRFSMDGVSKNFENTGSEMYYMFSNIESYVGSSDQGIMLINDDHDITNDSLNNLKGRKLPIHTPGASGFGGRILFSDNGNYYDSEDAASNPFPANYFRINNITFIKTETTSIQRNDYYILEGDFVCNTSSGGADKHVTNGTFRLVVFIMTL